MSSDHDDSKKPIDADNLEQWTVFFRQLAEATLGAESMNEVAQRVVDASLLEKAEPHETPLDWINDMDTFCTALCDALYNPANASCASDEEPTHAC